MLPYGSPAATPVGCAKSPLKLPVRFPGLTTLYQPVAVMFRPACPMGISTLLAITFSTLLISPIPSSTSK